VNSNTTLTTAKSALFDRLIDDASMFPPAKLDASHALEAHFRNRESAYHALQGRFVVAASRLSELTAALRSEEPLILSVILDGTDRAADLAAARAARARGMVVDSFEMRAVTLPFDLAPFADFAGAAPLAVWIESPFESTWLAPPVQTLGQIATMRAAAPAHFTLGAKVRCGGLTASAFPSVDDLAAFIEAAQSDGVAWKATAGLHHPIRRRQPETNFVMHGFLNVAIAAYAYYAGVADAASVRNILREEDPHAFTVDVTHVAWRNVRVGVGAIAAARAATLRSYGSCSFAEPVDDLRDLGILA